MPPSDVPLLRSLADLMGAVPFLATDTEGAILATSPGVAALVGGGFEWEGGTVRIGEDRVGGIPAESWTVGGFRCRGCFTDRAGIRGRYGLQVRAVGAAGEAPSRFLLRFDGEPHPEAGTPPGSDGLPIRPARETPDAAELWGLWSRTPEMRRLFTTLEGLADAETPVLVCGETGTGKEHVARALHEMGPRRAAPFVAVPCTGLPPALLEARLFGDAEGTVPGVPRSHDGLLRQARGGVLFLDEVAALPWSTQATLVRFLQDRSPVPPGGSPAHDPDVRVIAATRRSLEEEVAAGRFREDLQRHLGAVSLSLPPLRARQGDIELLLGLRLAEHAARGRRRILRVSAEAMRLLLDHPWHGNVRELQNVVEYAVIVGTGSVLTPRHLPPGLRSRPGDPPDRCATGGPDSTRSRILDALAEARGNRTRAARNLGIHRTTLWRWMRRLGIDDCA